MSKHGIVNAAPNNAYSRRGLKGTRILFAVESNDREPIANAADEQHGLFTADAVLAWHAGQSRVYLGQAVCPTAASQSVELNEQLEAGLVVDVIPVEHRYQY